MPRTAIVAISVLLFCLPSVAQYQYKWDWGLSAGFSPGSTQGIGVTPHRQLFQAGAEAGFVLHRWTSTTLKYRVAVLPLILVHTSANTHTFGAATFVETNQTTYGGGVEPIGVQFNFRTSHKFQPLAMATGGALYFTRQVPVPNSSQYNFSFSFGTGLEIFAGDAHSVTVGYRYLHISNGYTAKYNPGIDNNLIFVAVLFKRR